MKCAESENFNEISSQLEKILNEILSLHPQKKGAVFVIGCSTSEVAGGAIGKDSVPEIGKVIFEVARRILSEKGIFLACQCCEHLNRAIVVERECAEKYNLDEVCVVPWVHGGGSFATAAYYGFKDAVVVEHIKAAAGLDIGSTLIGMHLKEVAVPFHPSQKFIGNAYVTAAFSRPKLIGGERARYVREN